MTLTAYPCCSHCPDNDDCDGMPHADPCNGENGDGAYGYCSGGIQIVCREVAR
jgi:hypothetical protein